MATLADFRIRFPEFDAILDPRVQLFLDDAELLMESPVRWLTFYDVAHVYLAAHLLYQAQASLLGDGSPLAPVKKQEVDDVMIEQAIGNVKPTTSSLLSSIYGKEYYKYLRICFMGIYGV